MSQIIAVWQPYGTDTSGFSYNLATEISKHSSTALIESPCLGIPRLSVVSDCRSRDHHIEAALLNQEKKKTSGIDVMIKKSETLAVLPVGYYAVPDYPIVNRVEPETLFEFTARIISAVRENGYRQIVFECQGQLTHPVTFFAIKSANLVLIPLTSPKELAFTLINLKRLLNVFGFESSKFKILTGGNKDILAETTQIKSDDGKVIGTPDVWGLDLKEILTMLERDNVICIREKPKMKWKLPFQRTRQQPQEQASQVDAAKTIRL